jgi:excisionase family DNA binding protein
MYGTLTLTMSATTPPDIMTPEQAAAYLQVNRETVYRYSREGKLMASRLGRAYRIPRRALDSLLWTTRTRQDIMLREYTGEQIEAFLADDRLDDRAQEIAKRFLERQPAGRREPVPSGDRP